MDVHGPTRRRILVVDDQVTVRDSMRVLLEQADYAIEEAGSIGDAISRLDALSIDLVISDIRMDAPDDGMELLRLIRMRWAFLPVVLYTGWPDAAQAVSAIKLGADDYLSLPVSPEGVVRSVAIAMRKSPRANLLPEPKSSHAPEIVARSHQMQAVLRFVSRLAASDAPVLILGETGVGKEVVARAIHTQSSRCARPFVAVNCGAIPEGFAEVELFGHRKGAFTSAAFDRAGLVEVAAGGTLFLDEIGDLPLKMQPSLLRFLETAEYRRLGESRSRSVSVRVLSATNRSLPLEVKARRFRDDLYFRLAVITCPIPPLRQRVEDLKEFIDRWEAQQQGRRMITREGLDALMDHHWPGNVRECNNLLERLSILYDGAIGRRQIAQALADASSGDLDGNARNDTPDRLRLQGLLDQYDWKVSRAASALGISRVTLWRRMRQLNVNRHRV
jgi:two-component system response regulator PilR (NtrC family)